MKIYTKKGDDGTTGLLYGGRVQKDSFRVELNGAVDEAQAHLGFARSLDQRGTALDEIVISLEADLWVLMAEVATGEDSRSKLAAGKTLVTPEMVARLEGLIDDAMERFEMPKAFVVPGSNPLSAALDVARTVVRRAERLSLPFMRVHPDSSVGPYLNRLSDLCWALARWQEGEHLLAKEVRGSGDTKLSEES
ncbi:MAG: cob(I)yrinic acid a,c-diamide adenosyltransferase [Actinomycetota bacterium]|nr:cob(I)yrinic acid a,c-diamide adenosyltransferase [Actinomycetota bacterium]